MQKLRKMKQCESSWLQKKSIWMVTLQDHSIKSIKKQFEQLNK